MSHDLLSIYELDLLTVFEIIGDETKDVRLQLLCQNKIFLASHFAHSSGIRDTYHLESCLAHLITPFENLGKLKVGEN